MSARELHIKQQRREPNPDVVETVRDAREEFNLHFKNHGDAIEAAAHQDDILVKWFTNMVANYQATINESQSDSPGAAS